MSQFFSKELFNEIMTWIDSCTEYDHRQAYDYFIQKLALENGFLYEQFPLFPLDGYFFDQLRPIIKHELL